MADDEDQEMESGDLKWAIPRRKLSKISLLDFINVVYDRKKTSWAKMNPSSFVVKQF